MPESLPERVSPPEPAVAKRPETGALDLILLEADPAAELPDRVNWLRALVRWIRQPLPPSETAPLARPEHVRLRRLLTLLDHQPELKCTTARTLRSLVRDTCALDLFCETGLPRESGFFSETFQRLSQRLLPTPPYDGDLGTLFACLFPEAEDAVWVRALDEDTVRRVRGLFVHGHAPDEAEWNTLVADMEDAVVHLSGQVASMGGSTAVRTRMERRNYRDLPFARLLQSVNAALACRRRGAADALLAEMTQFHLHLDACHAALDRATRHLEDYGVSPGLVYQLERMRAQLRRVQTLMELLARPEVPDRRLAEFVAELVQENQERLGVGQLLRDSSSLFGRRLVDRSAEAGEHYITRTAGEYAHMLKSAAGGGVVMAGTTFLKVLIFAAMLAPLFQGFFAGLNYAAGFVLIQLLGFTVATKQPANTAPALARQMHELRDAKRLDALVDEIVFLVRSQAAAIFGNLALVVPVAILLEFLFESAFGRPLMPEAKARHAIESFSVLGPSLLYAAFTGVLLWLSGLFAAAADHWFTYKRIAQALEHSPALNRWCSEKRLRETATFLRGNIAGLAGNVSLGFMLGLLPEIFRFAGLPLDIRHVTLAAATLAAAVTGLGPELLSAPGFWLSVVGVLGVGLLNVAVSFSLAFLLAMRARDVRAPERRMLYRALLGRFVRRPFAFLLPIAPR